MDELLINPKKFPKTIMKCKDGKTAIGFSYKVIEKQDIQYVKLLERHVNELLEEELRVLYVAMTRAEHMVVLSNTKSLEQVRKSLHTPVVSWTRWLLETGKFSK